MIELKVDKSNQEFSGNTASLVLIDPAVMERHDLTEGEVVRVATFWRELWGRIGAPEEDDRGTGIIRLDRFQRQTLKARLHERVEINREDERPIRRVRLQPAHPTMAPLYTEARNVQVQGRVVAVIRRF